MINFKKIKKLGIITGNGDLPLDIITECKKHKIEPVCALIKGFANPIKYKKYTSEIFDFGSVGKVLEFFKKNNVKHMLFVGGVKKPSLKDLKTDTQGVLLLSQLLKNKLFGDNKVLETVVSFFEKRGLEILTIADILKDSCTGKGLITKNKIKDKSYFDDIKIGVDALKVMSGLDIGQAIVVQQGVIIGVEGIEGTEKLIERCAKLKYTKGRKPILVKIKKINQTKKADLPVIGLDTIKQITKAGFAGIVIDGSNCIVSRKSEVLKLADTNKIFIFGI